MKIKQVVGTKFFKNSFILIGGTLFAQLFPIILQPILRRLLNPEEFGIAAIYFSIVSILTIIASLNYNATIVLPKKDEDSTSLVMGAIIISFVFSVIIFLIFLLLGDQVISLFRFPLELKKWMYLIPLSIFLNSSHLILGNWLTRKKAFKKFAINKISRRVAEGIAQITISKVMASLGLLLGTFIGDLTNFFTYLIQYKKTEGDFKINKKLILYNLKRYIHFPKYSLFSNMLSAIGLFLPVIIVNGFYETKITGQFDLSRQILAIPLSLISVSVAQVFLQKITEAKMEGKSFKKLYLLLLVGLSFFSVISVLVMFFFGEELFVFCFGKQWSYAGKITEILVISYAVKFCISPFAISFIALEELRINSWWQFFYFLGIISLYFFKGLSFEIFIQLYIFIDIIFYLCYGLLTYYIINKYEKSLS